MYQFAMLHRNISPSSSRFYKSQKKKKKKTHHHKNACGVLLTAFTVRESNSYEVIEPNKHTRRLQASTPNAASSDCAKTGWYSNSCHYVIAKIYYFRKMSILQYQIKHVRIYFPFIEDNTKIDLQEVGCGSMD
jgi:hypothetical protein